MLWTVKGPYKNANKIAIFFNMSSNQKYGSH